MTRVSLLSCMLGVLLLWPVTDVVAQQPGEHPVHDAPGFRECNGPILFGARHVAGSGWPSREMVRQGKCNPLLSYLMDPGFCYISERTTPANAIERIESGFRRTGVSGRHPRTGRLTHLVGDGQDVDVTLPQIIDLALQGVHVAWQLWFDADTYVACSFLSLGQQLVRHAYSFDGLDWSQRQVIASWADEYFRSAISQGTSQILVIDPFGLTANEDWDSISKREQDVPSVIPHTLGVPSAWLRNLQPQNGMFSTIIRDTVIVTHQEPLR